MKEFIWENIRHEKYNLSTISLFNILVFIPPMSQYCPPWGLISPFYIGFKITTCLPPNLVKINSITHTYTVKYIFFSSNICFDNLSICFLNLSGSKFVTKCYLWQPRSQFLTQCTVQVIEEWRSLSNFSNVIIIVCFCLIITTITTPDKSSWSSL